jgi:hypothetical protein
MSSTVSRYVLYAVLVRPFLPWFKKGTTCAALRCSVFQKGLRGALDDCTVLFDGCDAVLQFNEPRRLVVGAHKA